MKYIITLFSLLFTINLSHSQTDVSGAINSDTTWGTSGSPYTVTGNVLVANGVTLTIEAGVTVKVNSGLYIKNEGVITAVGTSSSKITFESSALSNLSAQTADVELEAATTYYWRVKTSDGTNASYSIVYSFKTQ